MRFAIESNRSKCIQKNIRLHIAAISNAVSKNRICLGKTKWFSILIGSAVSKSKTLQTHIEFFFFNSCLSIYLFIYFCHLLTMILLRSRRVYTRVVLRTAQFRCVIIAQTFIAQSQNNTRWFLSLFLCLPLSPNFIFRRFQFKTKKNLISLPQIQFRHSI